MHRRPQVLISRRIRGWLRALGLRKYGVGVLANTRQGLFVVDPKDFGVGRALLDRGFYDTDVIDFLLGQIDANSKVVIVGAHIGALLVPIAKKSGCVVAFEPNPKTAMLLEANIKLNGITNVTLHKVAASSGNESLVMNHNVTNTGASSVAKIDGDNKTADDVVIEARSLDGILGDESVDLMIVDAEGYEVQVFSGAQGVLRNTRLLYTEYGPDMLERQGATTEKFVNVLRPHFRFMCHEVDATTRYQDASWVSELHKRVPAPTRGNVVNLLFMKE